MKISDYIALFENNGLSVEPHCDTDKAVDYISCNSNDVRENTLFLCKGAHFKSEYLKAAQRGGAVCYIASQKQEAEGDYIVVSDVRRAMALMANFYYNNAWQRLGLVGITGTKGKSTTAYFVKYILDEAMRAEGGEESAVISSIDTYDGVERFESHLTTPEPFDLHRHFNNAVNSGIDYLTMEVSSQALKYDRVLGVGFKVGCFLNIGTDHISPVEHADFEDYFGSKLRLFESCETAVVNLDSDHSDEIAERAKAAKRVITFSQKRADADIYAYGVHKREDDTVFMVKTADFDMEFTLTIPGLFNVENALAAIGITMALGIDKKYMLTGLMKARSKGRMEVYQNADKSVTAIVDYAHNELSFRNLFDSVRREYEGRRVVIVFGCPGYKAYDRRRDLGTIAGEYSQMVYITEEDPGEEPVGDISREIAKYVEAKGCPYEIIDDRGEAIRRAVMDCDEPTVVLITGKGDETRQKRGTEYIDCPSDVEYVRRFLDEYDVEKGIDRTDKINGFQDILPALHKLYGRDVVVKLGGSVLEDEALIKPLLEDIALLAMVGARVTVVHGGGKDINAAFKALGIEPRFENGYRITGEREMRVVEMVLSGSVNKRLVGEIGRRDVRAVGVSGKDGRILLAEKKLVDGRDIGLVGQIVSVDPTLLNSLLDSGCVAVLSPVGAGENGETYNINADDAATEVARALKADKLVFITDVNGIMLDQSNEKTVIDSISADRAQMLIDNGFVGGGMIPKLSNIISALRDGVSEVEILSGKVKNNLISSLISAKKVGTTIKR
ncbi:MAG: acetylglutamate kinase [Oscillospiraceae bacterium]|nr:acetylglutamate kinase [Oscillospiraceae bacterium]